MASLKRRRNDTGGTSQLVMPDMTFAQAASEFSALSDREKFGILFQKSEHLETATSALQTATRDLESAYRAIENLTDQVVFLKEKCAQSDLRAIDLEAWSRRNNLVFHNILLLRN